MKPIVITPLQVLELAVASKLVKGHTVFGGAYDFPHECPGEGCAVGEWLVKKAQRGVRPDSLDARTTQA